MSILETMLGEEYPTNFNMAHFKTLKSFRQRVAYCQENLQRISSGSSRIVYKIDDEKVLKLAKNQKGITQNNVEIEYSQYGDLEDIVAKVFDSDENGLWVEMQLARKVTPSIFRNVTGFDFNDYSKVIHNHYMDASGKGGPKNTVSPQLTDRMWNTEWSYEILNFIGNYGIPAGDLMRLSTYGLVKLNGKDHIVIIDYGLTNDVYASYYR